MRKYEYFDGIFSNPRALNKFNSIKIECDAHRATNNCLFNNCNEPTINSHILQRSGILDKISVKNHIIELRSNNLFKVEKEGPVYLKRIGINEAFSLPLFCSDHDNQIFQYIEKQGELKMDYLTGLLFSYRTLCAELRKKLRNHFFFLTLSANEEISDYMSKNDYDYLKRAMEIDVISIDYDLGPLKYILEGEILAMILKKEFDYGMTFRFEMHRKIDVCISAIRGFFTNNDYKTSAVPGCHFINAFPYQDKTLLITGFHKYYSNPDTLAAHVAWQNLDDEHFTLKITKTISKKVETWALSPNLYYSIPKEKILKLKEEWAKNIVRFEYENDIDYDNSFNLFR